MVYIGKISPAVVIAESFFNRGSHFYARKKLDKLYDAVRTEYLMKLFFHHNNKKFYIKNCRMVV